jgi:hypothetical protein
LSSNQIGIYFEIGVPAQKAFTITDGVTGVFAGQDCGTFLISAISETPNAAFLTAVTLTTDNTSSVTITIASNDTQFMMIVQTVTL